MNLGFLAQTSVFTKITLLIGLAPLVVGILCAVRPGERLLALMRPLTFAGVFAATANLLLGVANGLAAMGTPPRAGVPDSGRPMGTFSPRRDPTRSLLVWNTVEVTVASVGP